MVFFYSMSLYQNQYPVAHEHFRGVEVLDIGSGLSPEEFAAFVGSLVIPPHVNAQGRPVAEKVALPLGETRKMKRSSDDPPYLGRDQFFRSDMGYWGGASQLFYGPSGLKDPWLILSLLTRVYCCNSPRPTNRALPQN
jgi:hypothetical protein